MTTKELTAPVAKQIPHRIEKHGDVRIDPYFWIREKENPEVIALLEAENAYTEAKLAPVKALRETLFTEMKSRLKEDDQSVAYLKDGYEYYTKLVPGQQYAVYYRRHVGGKEEVVLDCNALAAENKARGKDYFRLGAFDVSPNTEWLAYATDDDGSEKYTIVFKNLKTGLHSDEQITGTYASLEWANDNRTIFYTMLDEHERPDRILRHTLGEDSSKDKTIYKEADPQLFVGVGKSRDDRYLFIESGGKVTSEIHYLDANDPHGKFQVIAPRRRGVLYEAEAHGEFFFILTNDEAQNFRLMRAPISKPSAWTEVRAGSKAVFLEGTDFFKSHLVLHEREDGLPHLRIVELDPKTSAFGNEHRIALPEPVYSLGGEANPTFDTTMFRFTYTSLVTPSTTFEYDMSSKKRFTLKTQEIPGGYDASQYRSERVFATAADGTRVPISIVYRSVSQGGAEFKHDGSHPLYLYAYGSYGLSTSPTFSISRLSLLDRGFVFAMAHIRGGSEMGRHWYDDGKFLKKKNTFTDFISCAEHLIKTGFTRKGEIAIMGGSAGGMLMGAVINMRPDLFRVAVAKVPFVDVVNTMLDTTLPLTTTEFEEWGNPEDREYYDYIKSYSPYDNVKAQAYPHLLVTSGLNDPRVTYWEPAKWVARLREVKTDSNMLLQNISMGAGHGGPSGRYEALKEIAMEFAFILMVFGRA